MNLRWLRLAAPSLLIGLAGTGFATTDDTSAKQRLTHEQLQTFVGTWIAKTTGESAPYLVLKFKETNGALTGSTTHMRIALTGKGKITGSPARPGESSLDNLTIWGSDLSFTWNGEARFPGIQARFVVKGTQQALLVIALRPEDTQQVQKIMKENPGTSGFTPVIALSRETEAAHEMRKESPTERWEVTFMAAFINTAEAQYKFKNGRYADYATLLHSGQLKETLGHEFHIAPDSYESETDPLPGYHLRLLIPPDAGSYQLFIREKTQDCGMGIFTDETGAIFEGNAADCPVKRN
jgi:hypothetical protein